MFKMSTAVTAIIVAGLVGLSPVFLAACTESCGLAPCGPPYPGCNCNPGDQQVTGPESGYSGPCPTYRECYSPTNFADAGDYCGSTLCMLPKGRHCDDTLSCNPGDIQMLQGDETCVDYPSICYTQYLCTQSITCRNPEIQYGGAGGRQPGERPPSCGDGIVEIDQGEECDMGNLNGVCFDANASGSPPDAGQGNPADAGCPLGSWDLDGMQICNCPQGTKVFCTTTCYLTPG
jgi:hypothetical protein